MVLLFIFFLFIKLSFDKFSKNLKVLLLFFSIEGLFVSSLSLLVCCYHILVRPNFFYIVLLHLAFCNFNYAPLSFTHVVLSLIASSFTSSIIIMSPPSSFIMMIVVMPFTTSSTCCDARFHLLSLFNYENKLAWEGGVGNA